MILEGIVTTLAPDGVVNVAPMGPHVEGETFDRFLLKPFRTARPIAICRLTARACCTSSMTSCYSPALP